jgi:hypothetical protein
VAEEGREREGTGAAMQPEQSACLARCPKCRWWLKFGPYWVVYIGNGLNLWAAYCWNPNCDYGGRSTSGLRVVNPRECCS